MSDWSELIDRATGGDSNALRELLEAAYLEIKAAARLLLRARHPATLQTTALVHSAFRRVLKRDAPPSWESPEHFVNSMATVMRNVVREYERSRRRRRPHPPGVQVPLEEDHALSDSQDDADSRLAVDEALTALGRLDESQARIVELRYYCGLTIAETSKVTGMSEWQVSNGWAHARAWLKVQVGADGGAPKGAQ